MPDLIYGFNADPATTEALAAGLNCPLGEFTYRRFPDGESYIRIADDVRRRSIALLSDLSRPDDKFLPLALFAETLRDLGAERIGLVAPYLPYMRQDTQFNRGEGVTSRYFAGLVSDLFNWLITVDPHLHRYHSLDAIYRIPTSVGHAGAAIADWIKQEITNPLLIGPDSESVQWVRRVAERTGATFLVLDKVRHGDRDVEVSMPEVDSQRDHTPVLIDDIVSSGHTMLETIDNLNELGFPPPVCIAVHALFDDNVDTALRSQSGRLVSCNTIPHPSNAIDIVPILVDSIRSFKK